MHGSLPFVVILSAATSADNLQGTVSDATMSDWSQTPVQQLDGTLPQATENRRLQADYSNWSYADWSDYWTSLWSGWPKRVANYNMSASKCESKGLCWGADCDFWSTSYSCVFLESSDYYRCDCTGCECPADPLYLIAETADPFYLP